LLHHIIDVPIAGTMTGAPDSLVQLSFAVGSGADCMLTLSGSLKDGRGNCGLAR